MPAVRVAVAFLLLAGCTEHSEPPLDLEAPDAAREVEVAFAVLPEDARDDAELQAIAEEFAPLEGHPELLVLEPESPEDADACAFGVKAVGLPAVHRDGRRVAFVEDDPPGNADGWAPGSEFVVLDVVDDTRSARERLADWVDDRGDCSTYEKRLRARVREYNDALRAYRPMQRMDVVVHDPQRQFEVDPSTILPASDVAHADRPVQALWHAGWFVMRVPGIRVLSREAKLDWRVRDELCDTDPHLEEVWGDREAQIGVAVLNHSSGACLCDDGVTSHPIVVPAPVFDEVAQRPSERYLQLVDAACEAGVDTDC